MNCRSCRHVSELMGRACFSSRNSHHCSVNGHACRPLNNSPHIVTALASSNSLQRPRVTHTIIVVAPRYQPIYLPIPNCQDKRPTAKIARNPTAPELRKQLADAVNYSLKYVLWVWPISPSRLSGTVLYQQNTFFLWGRPR